MRLWIFLFYLGMLNPVYSQFGYEAKRCIEKATGKNISYYGSYTSDTCFYLINKNISDSIIKGCLTKISEPINYKFISDNKFLIIDSLGFFNYYQTDSKINRVEINVNYLSLRNPKKIFILKNGFHYINDTQVEDTLYFVPRNWNNQKTVKLAYIRVEDFILNKYNNGYIHINELRKYISTNNLSIYELYYDTLKYKFSEFEEVYFDENSFDYYLYDTLKLKKDEKKYQDYVAPRMIVSLNDTNNQLFYLPESILKFRNVKKITFNIGPKDGYWIPEGTESLNKLNEFNLNCYLPEREKRRILENKNLKKLSYFYNPQDIGFDKKLPKEFFRLDSLESILINPQIKNLVRLRKMNNLKEIKFVTWGGLLPEYDEYDTINFVRRLSNEDKKWKKQYRKFYKLQKSGLLKIPDYILNTYPQIFKWYAFFGIVKLRRSPHLKYVDSTILLVPSHSTKNYKYKPKSFYNSKLISTLQICSINSEVWHSKVNYNKIYKHNYILIDNQQKLSKEEIELIIEKNFGSDLKKVQKDSLFNLKFTFIKIPKKIRHLNYVKQIKYGNNIRFNNYNAPIVFSKYYLKMEALNEIKLYVGDTLIKEKRPVWRQEAIANDKYDNEDLSVFSQIDAADFEIIDKLRKKGVKVYYEKIY